MRSAILCLLAGIAVGWLCGLSISPAIGAVIATLLTVCVTGASIIGGLVSRPSPTGDVARKGADPPEGEYGRDPARLQAGATISLPRLSSIGALTLLPITALCIGVAIGAPLGLCARVNDVFSLAHPQPTEDKEIIASARLPHKECRAGDVPEPPEPPPQKSAKSAGLYYKPAPATCQLLGALPPEVLLANAKATTDPLIFACAQAVTDTNHMQKIIQLVCGKH